jgi:hypothetical protein
MEIINNISKPKNYDPEENKEYIYNSSSIDNKTYIKYTPILDNLQDMIRKCGRSWLLNRKIICIFNCENDKYFITYTSYGVSCKNSNRASNIIPVEIPSDCIIDCDIGISSFVEKNCPSLNEYDFIKNNKIISIKELKSLVFDQQSINKFVSSCTHGAPTPSNQILKVMEFYENYLDNFILKYMHIYGINNVRGGSYIQLNLSNDQNDQIINKLNKLNMVQINGESTIIFDKTQLKFNLATKYLNMEHIEDEIIKLKTELAKTKSELAETKSELAETKTELAETKSELTKQLIQKQIQHLDILD